MVIELPYILGQTVMYTLIVYTMIHFKWTAKKFAWFFFLNYLTFLYFTYYGMMTVSITPNQQVASIVAAAFYYVSICFQGSSFLNRYATYFIDLFLLARLYYPI